MKLTGPKEVVHTWVVDGKTFTAQDGKVTPDPLPTEVDTLLFAKGFYWDPASDVQVGRASVAKPASNS